MRSNDELDKEIEALENEIFGTPGEESTEELGESEASTIVVETPKTEEPTAAEIKRFNNYKASTDITLRDLRTELANSKMKYANLQREYSVLLQKLQEQEVTPKKMFSEEEIDILGEPAANALDKGVNDILQSKLKPLQEELARSRKENADREQREANMIIKSNYDSFLAKLGKAVPDYAELNVSSGFLAYMKEADEYSGVPREYLFKKAEESLDVGRIASFFIDYKKTIGPKPTDILESAVTPTGSAGTPTHVDSSEKDMVITYAFIDKYYDDFNRGKYKTKKGREKAAQIEAAIDKAVFAGLVRN